MYQEIFTKLQPKIYHSFNRKRIFAIYKRAKLNDDTFSYWIQENGKKIEGRFLRQELFALNNQFEK